MAPGAVEEAEARDDDGSGPEGQLEAAAEGSLGRAQDKIA